MKKELAEVRKSLPKELKDNDNVEYTLHNLDLLALTPIDCKIEKTEVVEPRCFDYINLCLNHSMKPSFAGLALAIGVSRPTLLDYINGVTSMPNSNRAVLQRYTALLNALMEDYMQNGKINPIPAVFLSKNNFGYKDTQEFVVNNNLQEESSPETLIEEATLLFDKEPKMANIET